MDIICNSLVRYLCWLCTCCFTICTKLNNETMSIFDVCIWLHHCSAQIGGIILQCWYLKLQRLHSMSSLFVSILQSNNWLTARLPSYGQLNKRSRWAFLSFNGDLRTWEIRRGSQVRYQSRYSAVSYFFIRLHPIHKTIIFFPSY